MYNDVLARWQQDLAWMRARRQELERLLPPTEPPQQGGQQGQQGQQAATTGAGNLPAPQATAVVPAAQTQAATQAPAAAANVGPVAALEDVEVEGEREGGEDGSPSAW